MTNLSKIAQMHKSHKRKNTYVVHLDTEFNMPAFWEEFSKSPLTVLIKNGEKVQEVGRCMRCTKFPNPGAIQMHREYRYLAQVDKKLASTVVEYLDKDTGAPVALLYPTDLYVYEEYRDNDFLAHLNHASRQDFVRQMDLRTKMLDKAIAMGQGLQITRKKWQAQNTKTHTL